MGKVDVRGEINICAKNMSKTMGFKVALLGETGVGKTCIIEQFVNDTFRDAHDATKGASFRTKTLQTPDGVTRIRLQVWDTAGQELYRSLTPLYYKDADGVIVVYDVTNAKSLQEVAYWAGEVRRNGKPDCLLTIVGNKIDIVESQLDPNDGQAIATKYNANFLLASAKENSNVNEVFFDLAIRKFPQLTQKTGLVKASNEAAERLPCAYTGSFHLDDEAQQKGGHGKPGCSC